MLEWKAKKDDVEPLSDRGIIIVSREESPTGEERMEGEIGTGRRYQVFVPQTRAL